MDFSGREITSKTYDEYIRSQGLDFQKASYYEPRNIPDKRRIVEVLRFLEPHQGERILDIGCGVGTFAFHSAREGSDAIGIDYSYESVKAASALTAQYSLKGKASFLVANALCLPLRDKIFDKVIAADFIEHISDQEKIKLLDEIKRVLKQNGQVVIFTPNKLREDVAVFYYKLRHLLFGHKIPVDKTHYGLITKQAFEKIIIGCGLSFRFSYMDLTRPYLARIPILNKFLSLNLLWIMSYEF